MQDRPWKIVVAAAAAAALAARLARIGDDCWRGEPTCQTSRSGTKVVCAKRNRT